MATVVSLESVLRAVSAKANEIAERKAKRFDGLTVKPTIDNNGRAHAPCDGWTFEGVTYLAGQYLPDEEGAGTLVKAGKFVVAQDKCLQFKADMQSIGIRVSFGQPFDVDDIGACYAYVEAEAPVAAVFDSMIPTSGKSLALADEYETGSTWESTVGKIAQKVFTSDYEIQLEPMIGTLSDKVNEYAIAKIKGKKTKTEKVKVGYHYKRYIVA